MGIVVMKFGGTSVADAEKIRLAARRAIRTQKQGHQVVMVVSAMGKSTDQLESLAGQVMRSKAAPKREMDQLLATGEQVTISLMAMALEEMGASAISYTAGQIGIITDEEHTKAKIRSIDVRKIHQQLDAGRIVIVAGFQGVTSEGHVTTLGRGGSNVTLVAIATALNADVCENYTDVDGVFTADPRIVPNARKINVISYDEMLELATQGVNVLHSRAVEFAKKYNIPIHLRSSLHNRKGTMIVAETESMEHIVVSGAALKDNLARIALRKVPNKPGLAAQVFHTIARGKVGVDDIIQNINDDKTATISFTVELAELPDAKRIIDGLKKKLKCGVTYEDHLAKVSVVGIGMQVHTGVAERMFAALAKIKANIQNITTSEIKISVLIDRDQGKEALRAVHDAFELSGKSRPTLKKIRRKPAGKKTAKKKTARK
jgi:aspartate kinase